MEKRLVKDEEEEEEIIILSNAIQSNIVKKRLSFPLFTLQNFGILLILKNKTENVRIRRKTFFH